VSIKNRCGEHLLTLTSNTEREEGVQTREKENPSHSQETKGVREGGERTTVISRLEKPARRKGRAVIKNENSRHLSHAGWWAWKPLPSDTSS